MKIDTGKIITEMKRLGYSQNTLAPRIGKTRQALGYILKTGSTKFKTLGEIADALGMDGKDLIQ
jgi:lambda repressor-like predicted transcriptional regulator